MRYNLWLDMTYPGVCKRLFGDSGDEVEPAIEQETLVSNPDGLDKDSVASTARPDVPGKLSKLPRPPCQVTEPKSFPRARVLTSQECLQALEKEQKKEEMEAKEQRRHDREEKRKQKATEIESRKKAREERAQQKMRERKKMKQAALESTGSECVLGTCSHGRARNWVQCSICGLWFHCICVQVPRPRTGGLCFYMHTMFLIVCGFLFCTCV